MIIDIKLLKKLIKEEVGRNFKTVGNDNKPFNFKNYEGYDVEITGMPNVGWWVEIQYEGEPVGEIARFPTEEEANHHSRMVIDRDRIGRDTTCKI